jgi:hypothetical protein
MVGGLFLYQAHAQSLANFSIATTANTSSRVVYLSPQGKESAAAAAVPIMGEMHIANNGLVLLRGAEVISLANDTMQVKMTWNSAQFTWTVRTNANTKFFTSTGKKEPSPDIQVGDSITVTGMLAASSAQPTLDAEYIDIK